MKYSAGDDLCWPNWIHQPTLYGGHLCRLIYVKTMKDGLFMSLVALIKPEFS